ncbi:MAG: sulfatase [Pigmentiphaga sp.]|nr:sulfatase [Pigmentiphaga sp.]
MNTKNILSISIGIAGSIFLKAANPERPNIIYIMADDHASQAVSAYGGMLKDYLPTPNIDRIANEGVRLDNCFVTNSISSPSRAAIITGQFSHKNGVYTLWDHLDRNLPNVAKELQHSGYQTAMIGKWHLGTEPAGFDFYNVLPGQGRYDNPKMIKSGDWGVAPNNKNKETEYAGHSTDVITDEALKYLQNTDKNEPFFLMCHFKAPHRPWSPAERFQNLLKDVNIPEPENIFETYANKGEYAQVIGTGMEIMNKTDLKNNVPPEDATRDEKRRWNYQIYIKDYLRCIAGIDENVGRILQYLDNNGLSENTVVIYTSDQGFFLGEHGWFDKRLMYEESLRMPFVIRYPKEIPSGTVNDDLVMNVDFAPLFLDFAGVKKPKYMQGESFRKNLKGKTPGNWRKAVYHRYWMHADPSHNVCAHYGIRTDRYKLIYYYGQPLGMTGTKDAPLTPEWELFDLQKDPFEMYNVYNNSEYASIIKSLKTQLLKMKKKYNDEDEKYTILDNLNKTYFW